MDDHVTAFRRRHVGRTDIQFSFPLLQNTPFLYNNNNNNNYYYYYYYYYYRIRNKYNIVSKY